MEKLRMLVLLGLVAAGCSSSTGKSFVTDSPAVGVLPTMTSTLHASAGPFSSQTSTITPLSAPTGTPLPFPLPEGFHPFEFSPDGEWAAGTILNVQLVLEKSDGITRWIVPTDLVEYDDGGFYVTPEGWSEDGRYFYFGYAPHGSAGPPFEGFIDAIYRFDLKDGSHSLILPNLTSGYYVYAISPNANKLAYSIRSFATPPEDAPIDISVLDLTTNSTNTLSLDVRKDFYLGDFRWSPDERHFVVSVAWEEGEYLGKYGGMRVYLMDGDTLTYDPILKGCKYYLSIQEWISNTEVVYWNNHLDTEMVIDIETGNAASLPIPDFEGRNHSGFYNFYDEGGFTCNVYVLQKTLDEIEYLLQCAEADSLKNLRYETGIARREGDLDRFSHNKSGCALSFEFSGNQMVLQGNDNCILDGKVQVNGTYQLVDTSFPVIGCKLPENPCGLVK